MTLEDDDDDDGEEDLAEAEALAVAASIPLLHRLSVVSASSVQASVSKSPFRGHFGVVSLG